MTFQDFLKQNGHLNEVFEDELAVHVVQSSNSSMFNLLEKYFQKTDNNAKRAMHGFAKDLTEALIKYLTEKYVTDEDFPNDDIKLKYMNTIRNKISESLSMKVVQMMESLGEVADSIKITLPVK